MTPLRVLIADDEKMARARLRRLLSALGAEVIGECKSGEEALLLLDRESIDVAFFDVDMPGLDGLSAGAVAQRRGVPVVFVTAHPQHAVEAFSQNALHYLLKPVEAAKLDEALQRVRAAKATTVGADDGDSRIPLTRGRDVHLVAPERISHAVYDGELVTVYAGAESWIVDASLQELETRIGSPDFMRVHRRALINLARVERLEAVDSGGYIAHVDGHEVDVSRQAARTLRKQLEL